MHDGHGRKGRVEGGPVGELVRHGAAVPAGDRDLAHAFDLDDAEIHVVAVEVEVLAGFEVLVLVRDEGDVAGRSALHGCLTDRIGEGRVQRLLRQYGQDDECDDQEFERRLEFEELDLRTEPIDCSLLRQNREHQDRQSDCQRMHAFHRQHAQEEGDDRRGFRRDAGIFGALRLVGPIGEQQKSEKAKKTRPDQPGVLEQHRHIGADRTDQREDDVVAQARMGVFLCTHRPFKADQEAERACQAEPDEEVQQCILIHDRSPQAAIHRPCAPESTELGRTIGPL